MADDDKIPEMPADFAAASPAVAWERLQRANRQTAALQAQVAELTPQVASLGEIQARAKALEAEAETLRLRIPLARAGIVDDEVGDAIAARWRATQVGAKEPIPLDRWIPEHGVADKIVGPHLRALGTPGPGAPPAPPPPPSTPNMGTGTVTAPAPPTRVTHEAYSARIRQLAHLGAAAYEDPVIAAYCADNVILPPRKRK